MSIPVTDISIKISNQNISIFKRNKNVLLVVLTGISFMLIFTAFNTASQANESMLEGARNETDGKFDASGYTSLALIYLSCAVFNWVSPWIVFYTNARHGMFIASTTYVVFLTAFFEPVKWFIYLSSILIGIGAAILWTANGMFITMCSKTNQINRNFGIFWMLFQLSGLVGSIYSYFQLSNISSITSDVRVTMMAVLTTVGSIGSLLMLTIPKPDPVKENELHEDGHGYMNSDDAFESQSNDEIEKRPNTTLPSARETFLKSFHLIRTINMLAILLPSAFTGINLTFLSGVYGTCLSRMRVFGLSAKSYIGLSGVFISIGEILGSQVSLLNNKIPILLIMSFGYLISLIGPLLSFLMIPSMAPIQATSESAYIDSSVYLAMFIALLFGITDSLWNTQISGLLGRAYPTSTNLTGSAFALFKCTQSLASAIAFFYSSELILHWQTLLIAIFATAGFFGFIFAERRISNLEQ